jgi:excisionase family DNA binding protein
MSDLSVTEAAQRLQVSPRRVRALLADGRLPGRQIAGRWLLSSGDVDRRQQAAPPPGRPLSAASAWHVLAVLARADDALRDLAPPARSRARARAAELRQCQPADLARRWQSALGSRARTCDFYAHPSILKALLDDPDVLRSGISAASDHGADLMVTGSAEGYLRSRDLPQLQARYALSPDAGAHANLRLHVTQDDDARWVFRRAAAPAAVVAADLLERETPRDQAAGAKLAARL